MSKKKTSFTLNIDLLKDLKMKAVELGTSQTKLLEKFIKQGLKNNNGDHSLIKDDGGVILIENINPNLLKKISKIAKNEKISEEEAINEIIKKGINAKIKNKIPEHLILNKDTYNPDPEKSRKMIGIIKTDKPFDTTKAIREIRNMEY
ncbi:hypothetical protein MARBORIA2_15460 [Methanobrevibacter arboriphilus]|jgi:hypothetical protein|uniref:Uncharacterized protein n=1 Tax=Methanobrevibacter arboriphilus TaxID=39441 RepID=A0ACA8R3A4_METAZ|nr:hypothetical protein [Methanobrevibacter arboriphilus]BBL61672.1 hypothetical protein MarbSA_07120 [Methanobrevibacter arboriphilus]GLI12456.1 hypothetical protein MARBORIA2_15460 [Methanobrevibacter arboriphilus]